MTESNLTLNVLSQCLRLRTYISLFLFARRKPHKFGPTQNCHFCQKGAKDVIILCHNCCRSNFPKNATALCT